MIGLLVGVLGVVFLAWDKADFKAGSHGISPAWGIAACLLATVFYGLGANVSRKHLVGVPPMAVAAGSQLVAAIVMVVPAALTWPAQMPSGSAWLNALALAWISTGLAYVLYFRLIAHAGAPYAMSVTFLIPASALIWGWLLLHEQPTSSMLLGGGVILLGTALATGLLRLPQRAASGAS
jgi:drug/metabolite transporter (DMT)-like permease